MEVCRLSNCPVAGIIIPKMPIRAGNLFILKPQLFCQYSKLHD